MAAKLRSPAVSGGLAGAFVVGGLVAQGVRGARAREQLPAGHVVLVRQRAGAARGRRRRRGRTLAARGRTALPLRPAAAAVRLLRDHLHLGFFERAGHLDARPQIFAELELLRVLKAAEHKNSALFVEFREREREREEWGKKQKTNK